MILTAFDIALTALGFTLTVFGLAALWIRRIPDHHSDALLAAACLAFTAHGVLDDEALLAAVNAACAVAFASAWNRGRHARTEPAAA
ncbi:hypothetical protein [Streptomyces sp. NPDC060194]|uniref:hypothetical protein n=1 Tax=Streptomyces sp. NPDC060194 TaxID=3347069 RepID=UPI003667F6D6